MTSIGVKALLKCVFDVSSLNAISESNHTLERLGLFSRQTNGSLVDGIDRLIDFDMTQKIMLALQDKDSLLKCVFDVSSLNAISESNHMLKEMYIFSDQASDNNLDVINQLFKLDRTQKIVLALQDKDSLLKYLANVPVELIPEVLAFPLRRIDNEHQHEHLNIVYSTMRWWNMPMLYSYLNCVRSDTKRKRDK